MTKDTVRRVVAGIVSALGGLVAFRFLRRGGAAPVPEPVADPADALRTKLDEARVVAQDRDEFQSGETPVDEADPEDRRRAVHEEARARLDELRREKS